MHLLLKGNWLRRGKCYYKEPEQWCQASRQITTEEPE